MENFIISPNFNLHPVVNFKVEEVTSLPGVSYDSSQEITAINDTTLKQQAGRFIKYNGDIWYCTDLDNDDNLTWYAVTIRQESSDVFCYKMLDRTQKKIVDIAIARNSQIKLYRDGETDTDTGETKKITIGTFTLNQSTDTEIKLPFAMPEDVTAAKNSAIKSSKVTISAAKTPTSGYLKTYNVYQGEVDATDESKNRIGTIDIPKDFLIKSVSVVTGTFSADGKTFIESATGSDKAIKFVINVKVDPATEDKDKTKDEILYINVKDLANEYTVEKDATQIQLSISDTNEISASIVAGSVTATEIKDATITLAKLDSDLKDLIQKHTHDGTDTPRIDYNDLLNLPSFSEAVRYVSPQLTGGSGDIDINTHGCGFSPAVYCVKGTEVIEIYFEVDYNTGNVHWDADPSFTASDDVHIIMVGALDESSSSANTNKYAEYWCGYEITKSESDPRKRVKRIAGNGMMDYYFRDGGGILRNTHFRYIAMTEAGVETPIDWDNYDNYKYGQYGDIFVAEKQQLYFYAEETSDKLIKKLSLYPLDGFQPYYPEHLVYIGKYEATADKARTKIYSRVIPDSELASYIGGNMQSAYTEKLKGMPATELNTDKFRAMAKAKGSSYGIQDWTSNNMLFDMFIAEYGTTNCQEAVQSDDPVTGYRRGGLGAGVTNVSNWSEYNNYNPVCKCGTTDSLKNGSGEVLVNIDGLLPAGSIYANCLYGIEFPTGHIYKLMDGVHIFQNLASYIKAYYCNNPDKYQGATNSTAATDEANQASIGYEFVGNMPLSNGYVKDVIWGDKGLLLAKNIGAGGTTYFSDYFYQNNSSYSLRWLAVGGLASSGAVAGFSYVRAHRVFSHADQNYGSRLCYYKKIK